jgi:hypothetical protein
MKSSKVVELSDEPEHALVGNGQKARTKITIPSDLRFHSQALSVNVGNPCESPSPKPKGPRREKPLRASATTLKFCDPSILLAESQRNHKLENFNFNLSGSDPIVANRAGVILPYEFFLSTKKCINVRYFL